jgi:hypothetical protein
MPVSWQKWGDCTGTDAMIRVTSDHHQKAEGIFAASAASPG